MTLQQIEYAHALSVHGSFSKAAARCGVSQSTLSTLIKKMEEELDVILFDRESQPIRPTEIGNKIVEQCRLALYHSRQIKEIPAEEKDGLSGNVQIGIIPTVAPYMVPGLMKKAAASPFSVRITEARTQDLIEMLEHAQIDVAIMATPLENPRLLEIPLYYEKFYLYTSEPESFSGRREISQREIPKEHLWLLQEGHCLRNQVIRLCSLKKNRRQSYQAGSIDTLVRIVDHNGGCTILPELHLPFLSAEQKTGIFGITEPVPAREISFVIRKDFIREKMLNLLAEYVKSFIPAPMLDPRLKKYAIRI